MSNEFKAGIYYVGDPCYVIGDWDDFCDHLFKGDGHFTFKGFKVFVHSTSFGDGVYSDKHGHEYPVDSGTIGVIPIELLSEVNMDDDLLSTTFQFIEDFEVGYDSGVFHIGCIRIDTCYDEDFEDEEDY